MSTPTFSILHATYARPEKAVAAMRMWFERAARPEAVEYIFAVNQEDDATLDAIRYLRENTASPKFKFVIGDFAGSAPAWDAAAKVSTGDVLIQGQDDVEPPQHWDVLLLPRAGMTTVTTLRGGEKQIEHEVAKMPVFIATSDGFRRDKLCCTTIMNRAYYQQKGEFLHAGYLSVFSDDEVTARAYADAAVGHCTLIEARDLVFLHRHHYHDKSVPMDPTYERENSQEAYALGSALFLKRNADLVARGFKTW